MEDEGLLELAKKGDEEAFRQLYERYVGKIFHYVYLQVGDYHLAEELTQEVFLKMARGLPGFRREARFQTWLFTIGRNVVTDELRRNKTRLRASRVSDQPLDQIPTEVNADTHPEGKLMAQTRRTALSLGLKQLSEEQRSVLYFRYEAGYSLEETSRMMKRSVSAIKSLQWRAVNKLKQVIERGEVIE